MDGFDEIDDIPEDKWEKMTEEQQDAYNRLVGTDKQYDQSLNETTPIALFVIGCIVGFFGLFNIALGAIGGFLCMLAVLWEIIRVTDRSHRYQRLKDASAEYKRVMNPE
ncbi:hypothetical protein [Methanoregula sp.]|uniref:hypothetical protein n=1 Tax=Methanoregula sp. TaxID=2052170 RepID=UPI003BB1745B